MRRCRALQNSVAAILFSVLALSCAGQRAPEGGPVDTDPPVIVSTYPQNYTTHFHDQRIALEFDEYVDHRSVEESIFISPSVGALEFDWSGREVEIRFSEILRRNATYVVNVGTDVTDLRNRNKMAQAFVLAFSTGEAIDRGVIEGNVYPIKPADSPSGVMIFAYNLTGLNPDTLNPHVTRPDYVTQTGKGGEFSLRHLSFGEYRLIAVRDEYKNLLYDPETDEYGVSSIGINLTDRDTIQSIVLIQLAKADTTAPRLIKVTAPDQRHVLAEFSEPIDTTGLMLSNFQITDTVGQHILNVQSASALFPKFTTLLLVTDRQTPDMRYRLMVETIKDPQGVPLSPLANSLTFSGSAAEDTLGPAIVSTSIADSTTGVELQPELFIHFSDAVKRESADGAIALLDSARRDILIDLRWLTDVSVRIEPQTTLLSKMWYRVTVSLGRMRDLTGKRARDTTQVVRFQTVDQELFSSIMGVVADKSSSDRIGPITLYAENVSRKNAKPYAIVLQQEGAFAVKDIVEGQYVLHAFRDRNQNQKYDAGSLFPYARSERFVYYPDTLKVRARWPIEGVQLILR
ncbi:MAG: Ig-like domain-containing protein [Bacteroidota bacterium]